MEISMIKEVEFEIEEFKILKKAPKKLWYRGNLELLKSPKISIVGSRRPIQYTQKLVKELSFNLAKRGVVIVSGAAMGVDALAHFGAGFKNTIAIMPNGLDIKYPAVNSNLIENIYKEGLALSQFPKGQRATKWSFVIRNELVVALGEKLIIAQADLNSGSLRSAEYALKLNREIFVFPHRMGESKGTDYLLKEGLAKPIFEIEEFVNSYGKVEQETMKDDFLLFCQKNPTFEEAVSKFGEKVYEAEFEGLIEIVNGRVELKV
jgi:DNA processing protein